MLNNQNIGVFITGGIASYKMAELVRLLIKQEANVRVVMSQSATEFISPLTFQILTKQAVLTDTFDERDPKVVQHIEIAQWCDIALVAPATANILGKLANGIADDIVSTTLLAFKGPLMIAPAMNDQMLHHPATERNIQQLKEDGHQFIDPEFGFLAEGYEAEGRLASLPKIVDQLISYSQERKLSSLLKNKKIVVTAGGTLERIDPVRFISNDSSGKMGYAMAQAAKWLGGEVYLISTKPHLPVPDSIHPIYVESAEEMANEVYQHYDTLDFVVMAAAISDYRVKEPATQKIKKEKSQEEVTLTLVKNPDILVTLGENKKHQQLIGFAAETENLVENAINKIKRKRLDWIIANDVSKQDIGFNSDDNEVTLISNDETKYQLPKMSKIEIALSIWQTILTKEDRT